MKLYVTLTLRPAQLSLDNNKEVNSSSNRVKLINNRLRGNNNRELLNRLSNRLVYVQVQVLDESASPR